ncbi:LVIVD repeat-containing protein [Dyadobacter frigoris]|uniref:LVIVD repeat-containing protein n=1 Tax=Dyadobacter frigoris TaxID=2576211 RepID=A0A4U6D3P8_9BACT|nr:hypothetical protein [Dyadobacter frigoris]TKT91266.1 hypothetical protein FDK13_16625 [Dyadobacter frigoris]GLU56268.1 hypothetical protein Dfri01_57290 [Dyadobacter frigoris]
MKIKLFVILLASGLWSCKDQCTETRVVIREIAITHPFSEIRNSVKVLPPREIEDPGKIVFKDKYLFVSEIKQGVHVIDNSDPSNPAFISFIQIPGNGDIIINENVLYADSFCDLVSLDITDPANAKETGRSPVLFKSGWFNGIWWSADQNGLFFNEYKKDTIVETAAVDCEDNTQFVEPPIIDEIRISPEYLDFSKTPPRFVIQYNYLYTSDAGSLGIFNLNNKTNLSPQISLAFRIVFANISSYQNKIFIGDGSSVSIYDNSNPPIPDFVSSLDSVSLCDKIVVQNDIAYIAQREKTICGNENQLKLFDISNISAPRFIKKFPMDGPRALSIDFPVLYVCEGTGGFKVFDVRDTATIDQHLLSHEKDIQANNVFVRGKNVFVTATDGLYQLDATDPKNLRRLSKIPFKKI